ncbi:hypothetical protein IQ07DRAFT_397723 [Pyrenochaeta sp. DS3sAY3a]|nr:hypothetical protein IQ07DRAFT_397723 [Pyrenochaeta sp. DS3sAY3a]
MEPGLEIEHSWTPPPLPLRNPNRHFYQYEKPLPPLPNVTTVEEELLPRPLFYRTMTLPPKTVEDDPVDQPSPTLSACTVSSTVPSISSSSIGSTSTRPSTPATSAPSSPSSRARSLTYMYPLPTWNNPSYSPSLVPRHALRRKKSPRKDSLRSLRAKDSEACLQRVYDQRTSAYLDGSLFPRQALGHRPRM